MNLSKIIIILAATALALAKPAHAQLDLFPPQMAKQILQQRMAETSAAQKLSGPEARYLFSRKRWTPGSKVLVAFRDGSPSLHKAIAEQARAWTSHANIELDFGYNEKTGEFRKWSTQDRTRIAHIRIGFSEPGYWSYIGTDSLSRFAPANAASMNYQGFVESWPNLMPEQWKAVVIHEFGHALGVNHEHQHRSCGGEFRWEKGPNGEQSVYEVFQSWQGWGKDVVDVNLRPIVLSEVDASREADRKSVMFYAMPAQAFTLGTKSPCFIEKENADVSAGDILGAQRAYPKNPTHAIEVWAASAQASTTLTAARDDKRLTPEEKDVVQSRLDTAVEAKKPLLYIHIQRESDRDLAKSIQQAGRSAGFYVPGIENVSKKGLRSGTHPQVRYFRNADSQYAQEAAKFIPQVNSPSVDSNVEVVQIKHLAASVTRNLVEIWIP